MTLSKDGIRLTINERGYVEYKTLVSAIEAHDHHLGLPGVRDAAAAMKDFLGSDPATILEKDAVYVHPQVASYIAGRPHQGKVRPVLYCILVDHRSRRASPVCGAAQKEADATKVKLAEEKTKQIKLQSDVAQKAIATLTDYSVASRPHLSGLLQSIISQFDPTNIAITTSP